MLFGNYVDFRNEFFFIDLHLLLCWYYVVAVCGGIGGVCYKNLKDGHDLCKNVVYSSGVVG